VLSVHVTSITNCHTENRHFIWGRGEPTEMLRKFEITYGMERGLFQKLIVAKLEKHFHHLYKNLTLIIGNHRRDKSRPYPQTVFV
jgi:hypothetical protein